MLLFIATIDRNGTRYNKVFSTKERAHAALVIELVKIVSQQYGDYNHEFIVDERLKDHKPEHDDWFDVVVDPTIKVSNWMNRRTEDQNRRLQMRFTLKTEHHNFADFHIIFEKYMGLTHLMDNGYTWKVSRVTLDEA